MFFFLFSNTFFFNDSDDDRDHADNPGAGVKGLMAVFLLSPPLHFASLLCRYVPFPISFLHLHDLTFPEYDFYSQDLTTDGEFG